MTVLDHFRAAARRLGVMGRRSGGVALDRVARMANALAARFRDLGGQIEDVARRWSEVSSGTAAHAPPAEGEPPRRSAPSRRILAGMSGKFSRASLRAHLGTLSRRAILLRGAATLAAGFALILGAEALLRAHLPDEALRPVATRVYARPPVLLRGMTVHRAWLEEHLQRLGYQRVRRDRVGIREYFLGSSGWIIGRRPFPYAAELQDPGAVVVRLDYGDRITRLEDAEGRSLDRVVLEPELIDRLTHRSAEDRLPVGMAEVPEHLVQALLAVEDQRFFRHWGLDLRRIAGAFTANLRAGEVVQGGSTLTQQLAKNLFLNPRRSLFRKAREAAMAVVLELRYSKEEILEAYLNEVYLGQDGATALHGVGRAAEHFFGKDVGSLTLEESALLVALIRGPSLYSPFRNPELAKGRRNLALRLMHEQGIISRDELEAATAASLRLRKRPEPIRSARYFTDHLEGSEGGIGNARAVVTTLDARLQRVAEAAVGRGLQRLERSFAWLRKEEAGESLQAALVALDPWTGEILAMVGGRDYGASQFNRAVNARRQPGSSFKPVVALSALARVRGADDGPDVPAFTLASILEDEPLQVETPAGLWEPANYDRDYSGEVTLRDALERSLNVPFARLGIAVGPERIVRTARAMGIESPLNPFLSLALGAEEVTPLEMARAFGVLAAEGYRANTTGTLWKVDALGAEEASPHPPGEGVFDPAETYLVTSALQGAVTRGTGRGLRDRGFWGDVAAKSGTTNDYRDGWFVGYTPNLVVAVWVGFDRGAALKLPGASVALPIFADFLEEAVGSDGEEGPWGSSHGFALPPGIERVDVDPSTGLRGGWGCRGRPELFLEGTAPTVSCRGWRGGDVDIRTLLEEGGEDVWSLLRRIFSREGGRE